VCCRHAFADEVVRRRKGETGMREKAVYGVLSAEPGRGSDVGPNSPGRKQGSLAP
jgi:hypothetical protein